MIVSRLPAGYPALPLRTPTTPRRLMARRALHLMSHSCEFQNSGTRISCCSRGRPFQRKPLRSGGIFYFMVSAAAFSMRFH